MASLALPSVTATQAAKPGPPPALSPSTPISVGAVIFSQSLETSRTALRCRINKGRRFSSRPLRNPSAVGEQSATVWDLLRAEIASGTEKGKVAKEYMEKGMLVPDEIVVMVNGSVAKEDVFAEIDKVLSSVKEKKPNSSASMAAGVIR
ncbi:hypothetical protein GW17_00008592 [Ensete ventricosum]|nr:hypothetical protein GW17_00008592 [Ensete ventricosum]